MRENLYRAKRKDDGKWIEGYFYKIWDKVFLLWGMTNDTPNMEEVIPETVGQYTGLKDINDKKIFEGDIIKGTIVSQWSKRKIVCRIVWKIDGFVSIDRKNFIHKVKFAKDIEVIGNIHDNPELLEEEE